MRRPGVKNCQTRNLLSKESSSRAFPGVSDICSKDPGRDRKRIQNHTRDVPRRVSRDALQIRRRLWSLLPTTPQSFPDPVPFGRITPPSGKPRAAVAPITCFSVKRRTKIDGYFTQCSVCLVEGCSRQLQHIGRIKTCAHLHSTVIRESRMLQDLCSRERTPAYRRAQNIYTSVS